MPDGVDLEEAFSAETERVRREQLTVAGWNAELFKAEEGRFATHARIALLNAIGLAHFLHHNYVGTEHLLSGLVNDQGGRAAQLLSTVGVSPISISGAVTTRLGGMPKTVEGSATPMGQTDQPTPAPHLVPRVLQVLELAETVKNETNAAQIDTEHLLLGILREGGGMAVTLLQDLGVDLVELERQLLEV
jgi:ATP-dependent Clp protease ATP-binding subunit ClpC